jgi:hypothetical protein
MIAELFREIAGGVALMLEALVLITIRAATVRAFGRRFQDDHLTIVRVPRSS